MSLSNNLLKLAAKVAIDRLIGKDRTDELLRLIDEWKATRDKAKELADAKAQATDPQAIDDAIDAITSQAGTSGTKLTDQQRNELVFIVTSGLTSLEEPPSEDEICESLLPGKEKTFVVYLDDPRFTGGTPGRFFHFFWYDDTYRVRDFIEARILHPSIRKETGSGWTPIPLDLSIQEIWNASKVRIHSEKKYGLGFKVSEQDRWKAVLSLLTESARQLSRNYGESGSPR